MPQSSVVQWTATAQRVAGSGKEHTGAADQGPQGNPPPVLGDRGSASEGQQRAALRAEGSGAGARLRAQAHREPPGLDGTGLAGRKLHVNPTGQGGGLEARRGRLGQAGQGRSGEGAGSGGQVGHGGGPRGCCTGAGGQAGSSHGLEGKTRWCPLEEWTVAPATTGGGLWGGIRAGPGQSEVRGTLSP